MNALKKGVFTGVSKDGPRVTIPPSTADSSSLLRATADTFPIAWKDAEFVAQAGVVTMATAIASAIAKVFIRDSFHDKTVNGWYLNPQLITRWHINHMIHLLL